MTYEKGYFKALLDIYNFIYSMNHNERDPKFGRYHAEMIESLLQRLCYYRCEREVFHKYGGNTIGFDMAIKPDKKNTKVVYIREKDK